MSIKNSWAWRTPIERINQFTEQFKPEANRQVKESIKYWLSQTWSQSDKTDKTLGYSKSLAKAQKFAIKYRQVFSKVDPGFQFWIKDGFAYIVPYGIKEMFEVNGAEDWGYQDQVDEPNPLPDNWQQRCDDWNKLIDYPSYDYSAVISSDDTYFALTVLDCAYELGLIEIEKAHQATKQEKSYTQDKHQ